MTIYKQAFALLLLLLIAMQDNSVLAQVITRRKAKAGEVAPNAILVMLPTYARRAEYLKTSPAKLAQLTKDRDSMITKIRMDFNDNFTFSPVYYFADTNREKIANHEFEGVLLDTTLRPASNIQLDSTFQIVYFGYAAANTQMSGSNDDDILSSNQSNAGGQRLVVLNSDMTEVRKPIPNGANNAMSGKTARDKAEYKYTSPKYDIYYRPYAKGLSTKMENYYRKQENK